MEGLTFHIVDVFAEQKYAGNQLAVIRNAQGLASGQMQKIAKEMGFSETTFILSETPRDGGYDVRIFTPGAEVPFAGHPTLGTAYIIRHEILGKPADRVNLNLRVGQIPVEFEPQSDGKDILWMTPKEATFHEVFQAKEVAPLLGIKTEDIDTDCPIEVVTTGLPFVFVPLRSLEAVRRAAVVKDRWLDWVKDRQAKMVFLFCRQTVESGNHIHARMFGDYYGVPEDPATGSANSCFAAYLVKHHYFGSDRIDICVEQGYEMGRPSRVYLRAQESGRKTAVKVGGRVFAVAKGSLL
ncbi:MAG TPA: PhzF family phenazine biosynthesis protein [Sedimentisphaerales bacterium]|jgi:trans-2,3-dihydro-3-hydroxyanthranilate isomerase|nr:PhzF family phenazine biosynthesis protein [Sedimentisphaerales bacterium]HNU30435.1 PhzF family phenazine biosynthesis protein [Sedimentisphaerales bacterium]